KTYTAAEVAKHNGPDNFWMIINDNVYDVTSFLAEHPGGGKILKGVAGKDASKKFRKYHRPTTLQKYDERLRIGSLK
ncbi:cytochrome b5-like heme/steroid binding domain-containing protein, partial [Talaromyces proteolyticus]